MNNVLPIVPYKLYIVPLVAFFDAVYTDGVPICCITGVTSGETRRDKTESFTHRKNII